MNKAKILVVDDDPIIRTMICKVLNNTGYDVENVDTGEKALEFVQNANVDLILLDVMMPGMNGFEVCKEIRGMDFSQNIPVIMLTGLDDMSSIEESFESGATDFITKPINWVLLSQRIKYALRNNDIHQQLLESEHLLSHSQCLAKMGYLVVCLETGRVDVSDEAARILRINKNIGSIDQIMANVPKNEAKYVLETIGRSVDTRAPYKLQHVVLGDDGHDRVVAHEADVFEKRPGNECLAIAVQDITKRVHAEELIRYKTFYDDLTELPNQFYFKEHINVLLREADLNEKSLAVLFFGIDRFKKINDSFDHLAGDQVLRIISSRIKKMECDSCFISRYGGDVFALILSGVDGHEEIVKHANEILELVSQKIEINDTDIYLTASVGISIYPSATDKPEKLIKYAESSMRNCSRSGGNLYEIHEGVDNDSAYEYIAMENDIRGALERQHFQVFYQPQIDSRTKRVIGAEALIRWIHPDKGFIPPDKFIPIAEEVGLISNIGMFVIESVCEMLSSWKKKGLSNVRVGINLAAPQFRQIELVAFIETMLKVMEIEPSMLEFEITERIAVSDFEKTIDMLKQLKRIGVKTSMDDFGTGYSSLSYIQNLPIDTLKIDRAFVKNINDAGDHGEIARAIINMAKSLGMNTIAEGVETDSQYQFFKFNGADEIQGWYFSKALPADEFERFVKRMNSVDYRNINRNDEIKSAVTM